MPELDNDEDRPYRPPPGYTYSTGPTTPEGKATSSQNATRHGLCSNRLILPDEDPHEWNYLKEGWLYDYDPQSPTTLGLVLQAAEAQWLLLRARRRYNENEQKLYIEQRDPILWNEQQQKQFDRFTRYRTTAERAFQRALRAVEDLRRQRSLEAARFRTAELRAQEIELQRQKQSEPTPRASSVTGKTARKIAPPLPLEQWVQVTVEDGKPVTKLYPPNDVLLKKVQKMDSPPELVYRRLDFVNGIPPEYHWTAKSTPELFETGGAGIQRMRYETWLDVIEREAATGTGHIGPTGVGNLPRPEHRGGCECYVCARNSEPRP
jgi:hypothetical protein